MFLSLIMILYLSIAAAMVPVVAIESGRAFERGQHNVRELLVLAISASVFWPFFLGGAAITHLWRSR